MPRSAPLDVDPVFAEVAKAIYGDIDVREIAKFAPGGSDLHVDGPMTPEQAKKQKRIAQTGLAATGVATVAGLDAMRTSIKENRHRKAAAKAGGEIGPAARKLRRVGLGPRKAAGIVGGSLLALHGVELGADALGIHAQNKQLRQANRTLKKSSKEPFDRTTTGLTAATAATGVGAAQTGLLARSRKKAAAKHVAAYWDAFDAGRRDLTNEHVKSALANHFSAKRLRPIATRAGIATGVLGAAALGRNAVVQHRRKEDVAKAVRLRPLNALPRQVPSLRAKRPRLTPLPANPRTKTGVFQPVSKQVEDVTWTGLFSKVDSDKRQVFGWASVSQINGEDVVDLQGDIVPIEEIEKSAYKYVIESRKGGDMHRRVSKFDDGTVPHHTADMIESFVVTPEKLEKMGLPPDALPLGWWVGYKVNDDEQWALVKSGARAGFSIHGSGKRTPVSKMGPEVKDWDAYHALRRKGHTKESAARIVNASVTKSIREDLDRGPGLKVRAKQAVHPPAVKLHPVKSSAVSSMGYQPQTKRLAVEMKSRPGAPYLYKVKAGQAIDALTAPSIGRHFATEIRGKAKRAVRYSPADRARLFIDPQLSKAERLPGDNPDARKARQRRTTGLTVAGIGYLAGSRVKDVAPGMADLVTRGPRKIGPHKHTRLVNARTARITRTGGRAGAVLVGAGLLGAGEGAVTDLRQRNAFQRAGETARQRLEKQSLDNVLAKAFDSERDRHARQTMYSGVAAGGATVAGAAGIGYGRAGRVARKKARVEANAGTSTFRQAQANLKSIAATGPGTLPRSAKSVTAAHALHEQGAKQHANAGALAGRARKLTRVSRGSLAAAALLGATAYGAHDYDRRRGGRSYGY